jgi:hypothetical protein
MRLEIQLPTTLIGYVGVELRRREIGMTEHFLNRSQICSSLEEVRRKRVPEEMRVDAQRVQSRFLSQLAEDQEGPCACQGPTSGVQEELGTVP